MQWVVFSMLGSQQRNDALAVRKKQIAALNSYFGGSIRELQTDVCFEIVVAAPSKLVVRIVVTLPEQFPYQPPVIQCLPPISCAHLDANGYLRPSAHDGERKLQSSSSYGFF